MENNSQPEIKTEVKRNLLSYINPRENSKGFFVSLAIFLSILGLGVYSSSVNRSPQNSGGTPSSNFTPIANNTIVYGYWTKENSVISAIDLSTNKNSILAQLPLNIKHVKILDPERIIYIKDTDDRDYGKEIVVKTLGSDTETVVLNAGDGFVIDDYVISPNSQYLAVWEVSPPAGSTQLFGGRSRVYTVDIFNPAQKNLIYDETSGLGITLAYPIAITDTGELFIDRFLPNSGAGWGYGMSVSDFSGANKQNIASFTNGTISTQPIISKDGRKLLFTGYDGRKGSGIIESNGYRKAILIPNTIEIFDITTRQKQTLLSAEADDIFPNAKWDLLTGNIIYSLLAKDNSKSGNYIFNLATNTSRKIYLDNDPLTVSAQDSPAVKNIIAAIAGNSFLVFDEVVSDSALGNLGGKYNQSIDSAYAYDIITQTKKTINLGTGPTQFIDLKPEKYFSSLNFSTSSASDRNKNQLQLQSFEIKPSLAPKRITRQSDPIPPEEPSPTSQPLPYCRGYVAQQCNTMLGTNYPLSQGGSRSPDLKYRDCWNTQLKLAKAQGVCADSPLYLYGTSGQDVSVYSTTSIYPLNTSYSPSEGYSISLGENGSFTANGEKLSSLKFDYTPAIKIEKPKNGYIVEKDKVQDMVEKISDQLGFNEKETADTLDFIESKAVSPYMFISLFDDETSKKILPLIISPTPDVYRNVVFYIENLNEDPNVSYMPPVIEKIQRKGFTAVEISFIAK